MENVATKSDRQDTGRAVQCTDIPLWGGGRTEHPHQATGWRLSRASAIRCGRLGTCVHPLKVCFEIWTAVAQPIFIAPVQNIGSDTISDGYVVADDELTPIHVTVKYCCHKLLSGESNIFWQTLVFWIQEGVLGYPPQRLFKFGDRKHGPAIHLRPLRQVGGHESLGTILFCQIHDDRGGFCEYKVTVNQHRNFSGGIEAQEVGVTDFASKDVDRHKLEFRIKLLKGPKYAKRARRT